MTKTQSKNEHTQVQHMFGTILEPQGSPKRSPKGAQSEPKGDQKASKTYSRGDPFWKSQKSLQFRGIPDFRDSGLQNHWFHLGSLMVSERWTESDISDAEILFARRIFSRGMGFAFSEIIYLKIWIHVSAPSDSYVVCAVFAVDTPSGPRPAKSDCCMESTNFQQFSAFFRSFGWQYFGFLERM